MSEQQRQHRAGEREPTVPAPHDAPADLDEEVDDASEASFPASDPPAWMGMRIGGPRVYTNARPSDRPAMREPNDQ